MLTLKQADNKENVFVNPKLTTLCLRFFREIELIKVKKNGLHVRPFVNELITLAFWK